jgi:hypothetical protein
MRGKTSGSDGNVVYHPFPFLVEVAFAAFIGPVNRLSGSWVWA